MTQPITGAELDAQIRAAHKTLTDVIQSAAAELRDLMGVDTVLGPLPGDASPPLYVVVGTLAGIQAIAGKPIGAPAQPQVDSSARDQALEEAAKACEAEKVHVHKWHPSSSGDEAYNAGCDDSAAAIRALRTSTKDQADSKGEQAAANKGDA